MVYQHRTPPFGKFGKAAADLFRKKFDKENDFKNVMQSTVKTASGLVFTAGGSFDNVSTARLKIHGKKEEYGEFTSELTSEGGMKLDAQLTSLVTDTTFAVVSVKPPAKSGASSSTLLSAEYAGSHLSTSSTVEFGGDTHNHGEANISCAAAIGGAGFSVGVESKVKVAHFADLEDVNLATQFEDSHLTASVITANWGKDITASYIHKVTKGLKVGGYYTSLENGIMGVVSEYQDKNTSIKIRGDADKTVYLAFEQRFQNPRVALGFSSAWNLHGFSSHMNPIEFGLSCIFGEQE